MRSISKGAEPRELAEARKQAAASGNVRGSDWDHVPAGVKSTVRQAVHRDQLGLCAYCGVKIKKEAQAVPPSDPARPEKGGMTIEHWIPRSGYPDDSDREKASCGEHSLEWLNLLGACVGVALVSTEKQRHCDAARGRDRLFLHPAKLRDLCLRFMVTSRGELRPQDDSDQEAWSDIQVLQLNVGRLKENRRAVIQKIQEALRKDDSERNLRKLWHRVTRPRDGILPSFAADQARYLAKKLRRRGLAIDWGDHPA